MTNYDYISKNIDAEFINASINHLQKYISSKDVLNLGVGYGVWDSFLSRQQGLIIDSLDIDPILVKTFSEKFPSIHYYCCDVYKFKPIKRYNTIIASHFLEHLPSPIEFLQLSRTWLTPDGVIIIIVPNSNSIHRQIGVLMGQLKDQYELNEADHKIGHMRVYDHKALISEIKQAGFSIEKSGSITLKALPNSKMQQMPGEYVKACLEFIEDSSFYGGQLFAVCRL